MVYTLTDGQVPLKHTLGVNIEGQTLERPRDLEVEIFPIKRAEKHIQHMRKCNRAQGVCTLRLITHVKKATLLARDMMGLPA